MSLGFAPSQVRQWPHKDIVDLIAYDRIEPFGSVRDNWHMAVQAQMFAAAHGRKGHKPPPLSEFMYKSPEENRKQKHQQFFSKLRQRAAKNGN